MTKHQADQVAEGLRAAGWPVVYVEMSDDGKWRAVAEDPGARDGWLTAIEHPGVIYAASGSA
jgi:hypothetical protein